MKFKTWINETNKGLVRMFRQQAPNLPKYVAKQVLQNRINPLWQNTLTAKSPTILGPTAKYPNDQNTETPNAETQTMVYGSNQKRPTYSNIKDIFGDKSVSSISGNNKWELKVIEIHPLMFTNDTIQAFLSHNFGSSPDLNNRVKNHSERMKTQSDLALTRTNGSNEPIILVKDNNKYRMQEGWHRLYSYLMQFSAPPEEKQKIENGQINQINFNAWKPVKIKAYIGNN